MYAPQFGAHVGPCRLPTSSPLLRPLSACYSFWSPIFGRARGPITSIDLASSRDYAVSRVTSPDVLYGRYRSRLRELISIGGVTFRVRADRARHTLSPGQPTPLVPPVPVQRVSRPATTGAAARGVRCGPVAGLASARRSTCYQLYHAVPAATIQIRGRRGGERGDRRRTAGSASGADVRRCRSRSGAVSRCGPRPPRLPMLSVADSARPPLRRTCGHSAAPPGWRNRPCSDGPVGVALGPILRRPELPRLASRRAYGPSSQRHDRWADRAAATRPEREPDGRRGALARRAVLPVRAEPTAAVDRPLRITAHRSSAPQLPAVRHAPTAPSIADLAPLAGWCR